MTLPAYSKVSRELKQLRTFHDTTIRAYARIKGIQDLALDSVPLNDAFRAGGIKWSRSEKRLRTEPRKRKVESILRELILVRAISALETYLTDVIRDIFVVTKTPFMDKSVIVSFNQEELIANNSPTKIYSKIINKETRKLTSGGFNEFIKYYKRRFDIDLSQASPGYKKMNKYHDIRNILVHRLGKTDDLFRKKYHTDVQQITVDQDLIDSLFTDLSKFIDRVAAEAEKHVDEIGELDTQYDAKYVADILLLKNDLPNCLHSSFQYWADDEYVMMTDILLGTSAAANGRVRYHFNGSDRALRHLRKKLRKEQKKLSISLDEVRIAFRPEKRTKYVPEDTVKLVLDNLPEQPWPKGIHKDIAKRIGVSNGKVSVAIDMLIARGAFRDQVDGKVI